MEHNDYKLDNRTNEDILKDIDNKAKVYVPEWKFDEKNPDIGSVIALIYASQLKGNIERFNNNLEKYHTEMVNWLDISLMPACPAKATVLMEIANDSIMGVPVKKGTKLLADGENEKIVFETVFPVYMSGAKIDTIFMTSGKDNKVIPVLGEFEEKDYAGNIIEEKVAPSELKEFSLFDFSGKGLEKQALLLYHDSIFDVENELLDCKITGNNKLLSDILAGDYKILYYSEEGFLEAQDLQVIGEHIFFSKKEKSKKITINKREYSLVVIEAVKPQRESVKIQSIEFASTGKKRIAEYVGNGSTDFDVNCFNIFGDTLELYSESYIGMDSYFSKKDSRITLSFKMSFKEKYIGPVKEEQQQDLRIIKRKKKYKMEENMAYTSAQEISIEYFNGIGWKRLICDKPYSSIFEHCEGGEVELTFTCPSDWCAMSLGGYQGRVLRFQLLRADNCYYQPCMHRYPQITDLGVSYTYSDNYKKPDVATALIGTDEINLTNNLHTDKPFVGFSKGKYEENAIYIGFDKVFDNGPISLWWKIRDSIGDEKKLRFFYSTNHEFKEMKIVDGTDNLSKSGVMMFMPETDMGKLEVEGKKLCWLKIVDEIKDNVKLYTKVERLCLNAVEVYNVETLEEEEFYIDTVSSDMSFHIRAERILEIDLWVNEKNEHSKQEMLNMLSSDPDNVRVSLDYLGEIEEFYVKWKECNSFSMCKNNSRNYILDRMQSKIIFGDGIHVNIPRNTEGTAFIVQAKCCNGKSGNVPAGAIAESSSNILFINSIYNPEPAYGGSDLEMLDKALLRGASLLSSGGRFVTEQDYLTEIMNYSDDIEKATIIKNVDKYGKYVEGQLNIVLLMKDYLESSSSFIRVENSLKKHLLKRCELSILPSQLVVEEPIFVELCVDAWIMLTKLEDSFEVQSNVEKILEEFINPIAGKKSKGWNIGTLPRKSQIMMRLNTLKRKGIVKYIMVTAKYQDKQGMHEVDLDDLKVSPFMIAKSGTYKVHFTQNSKG